MGPTAARLIWLALKGVGKLLDSMGSNEEDYEPTDHGKKTSKTNVDTKNPEQRATNNNYKPPYDFKRPLELGASDIARQKLIGNNRERSDYLRSKSEYLEHQFNLSPSPANNNVLGTSDTLKVNKQRRKYDQAFQLEHSGKPEEAILLYQKIMNMDFNTKEGKDAKHRIEQLQATLQCSDMVNAGCSKVKANTNTLSTSRLYKKGSQCMNNSNRNTETNGCFNQATLEKLRKNRRVFLDDEDGNPLDIIEYYIDGKTLRLDAGDSLAEALLNLGYTGT